MTTSSIIHCRFTALLLAGMFAAFPLPAADLDLDGIDDALEDEIAARFAPYYRLFPNWDASKNGNDVNPGSGTSDEYQPSSFDWFLIRSELKVDGNVVKVAPTMQDLLNQTDNDGQSSGLRSVTDGDFKLNLRDHISESYKWGDLATAKCYVRVRRASVGLSGEGYEGYYVTYIFFFPYSGERNGMNGHEGDTEHVTVCVTANGRDIIRVFFDSHGERDGSHWYGPQEVHYMPGTKRIIVYSASHSHASYPFSLADRSPTFESGWDRSSVRPHDHTADGGDEWDTLPDLVNVGEKNHPLNGQVWIQFCGRIGDQVGELGGIAGGASPFSPAYKDMWDDEYFRSVRGYINPANPLPLETGAAGLPWKTADKGLRGIYATTEQYLAPGDYGFKGVLDRPMRLIRDPQPIFGGNTGSVRLTGTTVDYGTLEFYNAFRHFRGSDDDDDDDGGSVNYGSEAHPNDTVFEDDPFILTIPPAGFAGPSNDLDDKKFVRLLRVPAGTVITVYDDLADYLRTSPIGDRCVITVKQQITSYIVPSFEKDYEDDYVRVDNLGNGDGESPLDGDVHSVKIVTPAS